MAKRKRYSEQEKKNLIAQHKATYLSSKRRKKINGELITEKQFDKLPLKDQWLIINRTYVSKGKETLKGDYGYKTIKKAVETIKRGIDNLTDEEVKDLFKMWEDITEYYKKKTERQLEIEKQNAQKRLEEAQRELQRIENELESKKSGK